MQRQTVRCNPKWRNRSRMDTVFVSMSNETRMGGLMVAQIRLFFTFTDPEKNVEHSCALVNWFPCAYPEKDPVTGMWIVEREEDENEVPTLQIIPVSTIVRGAHLLPVYGHGALPEEWAYSDSLDGFKQFYVNCFIDYHAHELLSDSV